MNRPATKAQLCEACERNPAEHVEPCDNPAELYHICSACLNKLHTRALRPLEWFNLVKKHGWSQFLLHDDFYDEDGSACQPEEEVECPEDFPAPTLNEASRDARMLLDFSITRWHFAEDVATAWRTFSRQEVLAVLSERFSTTSNLQIRSRLLDVSASTLAETGMDFVRYVWGEFPAKVALSSLAKASAACLPFREGFDRVVAALESEEGADKRNLMFSLGYFHSPEALDWIENHVFEPITEAWGYLAAASRLDWCRVERWLEQGRPLSLVAIDALDAIVRPRTPFLSAYGPRLCQPPSPERFRQLLSAYAQRDRVPRVEQRVSQLITCAEIFTKSA